MKVIRIDSFDYIEVVDDFTETLTQLTMTLHVSLLGFVRLCDQCVCDHVDVCLHLHCATLWQMRDVADWRWKTQFWHLAHNVCNNLMEHIWISIQEDIKTYIFQKCS